MRKDKKVGFLGGSFLPFHQGHAYLITSAYTQCDKLYIILSVSEKRDRNKCEGSMIDPIPWGIRLRWLRQYTKDMDNVEVLVEHDDADSNETYDWEEGLKETKRLIPEEVNVIFSSEPSYERFFKKVFPKAKHVVIDDNREMFPISSTAIREEGVIKHWEYLPDVVKPYFVKKVVIVGTESCGKSTLVRNLAKLYNTQYVKEYGRTMCEWAGGEDEVLTPDLYPYIAYIHKAKEFKKQQSANKILFIDTEALVTKYYLELYANQKDKLYDHIAKHQDYDLILFLSPDVPWVNDGTRSHGEEDVRRENHMRMMKIFEQAGVEYKILKGSYKEKFQKSLSLINQLLS
jgi:HTH-type transcriptional repressor of NAD biosynthesis genes